MPELDSRALAELMDMGFPEALCRNALLWGRNAFQPALEWLLAHAEDPGAAEPLRCAAAVAAKAWQACWNAGPQRRRHQAPAGVFC